MFRNLCRVAAITGALMFPLPAFAGHMGMVATVMAVTGMLTKVVTVMATLVTVTTITTMGHGHGGRWWHDRWWGYGVGSCWRWTPYGYIWVCY